MSLCIRAILLVALLGWSAAASAQATFDGQGNQNVKMVPGGQTPPWGPVQIGAPNNQPVPHILTSQYPLGAIPITATATGTTAATTATLAATAGRRTFICGFAIGATAATATVGNATITGVATATMNFEQGVGAATAVANTIVPFNPCIPAAGLTNSAIAVVSAAAGTSGVTSVSAWGYAQ